jgi:hypothetical protein
MCWHCDYFVPDRPTSRKPVWAGIPESRCCDTTPDYGGLVPVQQFGNLRLIVSGLHERVNLISFSLAEVFVGHKQLCLLGQGALTAKHPLPPNHQLFKLALRA